MSNSDLLRVIHRKTIALVFLLVATQYSSLLHAQALPIQVETSGGDPITSAVIQVFGQSKVAPIGFLLTDSTGKACCIQASTFDSLIVTHLTMSPRLVYPADVQVMANVAVIRLDTQSYTLSEATVTGTFSGIIIRGDTIRFIAEKFADGRELDLKELINRFPGLEVGGDGVVRYQGKPVDRVVIDGRDVVRSQFDLLNSMIRPREVVAAEVVTKSDARGNPLTTFDVKTNNPQSLRANIAATLSARAQPKARGNVLDTRNRLQGYVSADADYIGTPAGGGGVNLREDDQDVDRVIRNVVRDGGNNGYVRPPQQSINRGRSHFTEAHLVQEKGAQEVKLYASYRQSTSFGTTTELLRDASSAERLGFNRSDHRFDSERLKFKVSFQDSLTAKVALITWLQAELSPSRLSADGFSTIGNVAGPTRFRNEGGNHFARAGGLLSVGLPIGWALDIFASFTERRVENDFELADITPVYGINFGAAPYMLEYGLRRRQTRPMGDLRVWRQRGGVTLGFGIQYSQLTLTDDSHDRNLEALVGPRGGVQRFPNGTVYAQYRKKTPKHELFLEPGVQLYAYTRKAANYQQTLPLIVFRYQYRLPNDYRFNIGLNIHARPFDENLLWTTALPIGPRQLSLG